MNLLKFRIIGHPLVPNSSWLEVGDGLHIIRAKEKASAQALLRMLQTINPPYDSPQINPFGNLPLHATYQSHTRKIVLSKKTVALAIYAASPELVAELAVLDPIFYETGWIELGRRRDYSRWMNFVELSGSARWSEIAGTVMELLADAELQEPESVRKFREGIQLWRETDRIKDQRAQQLKAVLQSLRTVLAAEQQPRLDRCLQAVDRATHFNQAKEIVAVRLPLFLAIPNESADPRTSEGATAAEAFCFLATKLLAQHPEQASRARTIHQLNQQLRQFQPTLRLRLKEEECSLILEDTTSSSPLWLGAWPPAEKITAALVVLSVLHRSVFGCEPILLLDCNGFNLQHQDRLALLKQLLQFCANRQCLVVPDSDFLALCVAEHQKKNEGVVSTFRFLEI